MNFAEQFIQSPRPHCLMITNHGVHQWQVIPGLPDTGGQNIFVNQFTQAMADFGYRVTIINRGGYPHPKNGEKHQGIHYRDQNQRLLYIEDDNPAFIRKEDMLAQIPQLSDDLVNKIDMDQNPVDLIISHYWDGAMLAQHFISKAALDVPHIWIPHSLGAIKRDNMPQETWKNLKITERIKTEISLLQQVDRVGTTSPLITQSLRQDYNYHLPVIDMPPCVDPQRYFPFEVEKNHEVWKMLCQHTSLSCEELQAKHFVTEISRTDETKRKDVLLRAFAQLHKKFKDTCLLITITENKPYSDDLLSLIQNLEIEDAVIVLGSVFDWLPAIYNLSAVYCTPSVMEGFGMSAQEAAACGVPVVSSNLVPFVKNYLLGGKIRVDPQEGNMIGLGGITVAADDPDAFASALIYCLEDPQRCKEMGEKALHITVPFFTWKTRVAAFIFEINQIAEKN